MRDIVTREKTRKRGDEKDERGGGGSGSGRGASILTSIAVVKCY